jgi:hypothetical protein
VSYAFADLDVTSPLAAVTLGPADEGAAVLVRRGGRPLGLVLRRLAAGTVLSPASVSQLLADELRVALVREAITDELRPPVEREPPAVTVVHGEPGDRALRAAATPWVAFVATGARLDAQWSAGLGEAIAEQPDAAAVTGLVLPAELSTAAAVAFEQAGGLHLGFEKRRFAGHVRLEPPLQPVETWGLGSVGNLAVRRDAALAAGGAGAGAGDLLLRLLRAGHAVAYEPRMLVFHTHGPSATGPRLVSQAARLARPGVEQRGAALRALAWTGVRRLRRGNARP